MPFTQGQKDAINTTIESLNAHMNTLIEAREELLAAMRGPIDATLEAGDVTDIIASCKVKAKAAADALSALFA